MLPHPVNFHGSCIMIAHEQTETSIYQLLRISGRTELPSTQLLILGVGDDDTTQ